MAAQRCSTPLILLHHYFLPRLWCGQLPHLRHPMVLCHHPLCRSHSHRSNSRNFCLPDQGGVITERCYGCGRCFPVCPYDKISRDPAATSALLERDDVDAIKIHTSGRQTDLFKTLRNRLSDLLGHVKLVALDGRPMSGGIGRGATREAIAFAVRLASIQDKPHGFYQLAGGTNSHTVDSLKKAGLFKAMTVPENPLNNTGVAMSASSQHALISEIAYGGYARKLYCIDTLQSPSLQFSGELPSWFSLYACFP